jgi:uncharacterized membrane protein (DUF106 family)
MAPSTLSDMKNQVNLSDGLVIIFLALLTNVFSEFLSWVFIYRKRKYKDCKKQIDSLNKKIEIAKESVKAKTDKKLKLQETDLKGLNMEMMKVKYFILILFSRLE